jgi:hypothetical protein
MATLSPPSSMPTTLGMQIDALLDEIDSLSSTQLYAIIVAVTVIVSFVLLGTHNAEEVLVTPPTVGTTSKTSSSSSSPTKDKHPTTSTLTGPEPRWHIFRWVNWLAIIAFFCSVIEFGWNAHTYLKSTDGTLLKFLVGWSVFLGYFFGFFGVSFVHDIHAADDAVANQAGVNQAGQAGVTTDADASNARYVYVYLILCHLSLYYELLEISISLYLHCLHFSYSHPLDSF